MEQQYFTPEISDIKIGYELQYHNWGMDELGKPELNYDRWDTVILNEGNVKIFMEYGIRGGVRVPYLTKEQIEAEGWIFQSKSTDTWFYKEGIFEIGNKDTISPWRSYKITIHYGFHDMRLFVNADDQGTEHKLFEGDCKCINDFHTITKLLNI